MLHAHGHVAALAFSGCNAAEQVIRLRRMPWRHVVEQLEIPVVSLFPGVGFELEPKILWRPGVHNLFDFFAGYFGDLRLFRETCSIFSSLPMLNAVSVDKW